MSLRPWIEGLEGRALPASLVVSHTADDSLAGSLRWAIEASNASAGVQDTITFDLPAGNPATGTWSIALASALPAITDPVIVDGTTQPGFDPAHPAPVIQLYGGGAGRSANGLWIQAGGSTVRGLAINGFSGDGILVEQGDGNTIQGNFLGVDLSGAGPLGNAGSGIDIRNGSSSNLIGGASAGARNVISGNQSSGILIDGLGTDGNTIQGNFIGTNAEGTAVLLDPNVNFADGVDIQNGATNTLIGGATPEVRNLLSGNYTAVFVDSRFTPGADQAGTVIQGNYIGTDPTGTAALPNYDGVFVRGTTGILIRDNVLSGNYDAGLVLSFGTTGALVQGNFIGTDAAGTEALPNADPTQAFFGVGDGIDILSGASGNLIGGTTPGARNVISGNLSVGITIFSAWPDNVIQGNYIGTDVTGTAALPNGHFDPADPVNSYGEGIFLSDADGTIIGGTDPGAGNVISGNRGQGIYLRDFRSGATVVQGNLIGTAADGTTPLGNTAEGIYVVGFPILEPQSNNVIGGTDPGAGNVIAHNAADGVYVVDSNGNAIRQNRIHDNGGLGIHLDDGGGFQIANQNRPAPTLTSATTDGSTTTVAGTLHVTGLSAHPTLDVDFFSDVAPATPGGPIQGRTFLGSAPVTLDGSGDAAFSVTLPRGVPAGQDRITATATDALGNTSGFAPAVTLTTATTSNRVTWIGDPATSTDWDTAANWDTGAVPDADSDVVIPAGAVVTHAGLAADAVRSLRLDGTLTISGGHLALARDSVVQGGLSLVGGGLGGDGDLTVGGLFTWTGGALDGAGATDIADGGTWVVDGSGVQAVAHPLFSAGTIDVRGGTLLVTGGGSSGGTRPGTFRVAAGASVEFAGTYTLDVGTTLTGQGLVRVSAGTVTIAGGTSFAPTLFALDGGTLDGLGRLAIPGGGVFTWTGGAVGLVNPLSVGPGGSLVVAGGGVKTLATGLNNMGTVDVQGGTLIVARGGSSGGSRPGVFLAEAGTSVEFTGGYTFGAGTSLAGPGLFKVGAGAVAIAAGASLSPARFELDGGIVDGPGSLTVAAGATFTWNGGTMSGVGTTAVAAGGTLILGDSADPKVLSGRVLANAGTIRFAGAGDLRVVLGASVNNQAGGLFDFQSDADISADHPATGTFTNAGTLVKSAGFPSEIAIPFADAGTVDVRSGTLLLNGTVRVDGGGILTGQAGATLSVRGSLLGDTKSADLFAPMASVVLTGPASAAAPQLLEVMGRDRGTAAAGFFHNFVDNRLELSEGAYVKLVDNSDNATGAGAEALYVNSLFVAPGSTLDLNGLQVFARQAQVDGTIVGGSIRLLADGGPLVLGNPTPGAVSTEGGADDWTFYGRAGQEVQVVVRTGAPAAGSTASGLAQLILTGPDGDILASESAGADTDVVFPHLTLPDDGTYSLRILAAGDQSAGFSDYVVTVWNAAHASQRLSLGQEARGNLDSPYRVDTWTFSASAHQQVQFVALAQSGGAIRYDLTGPNGDVLFEDQSASSGLVELPFDGEYAVTVHTGGQPGAYAFRIDAQVQDLLLEGSRSGSLVGAGQSQLFSVSVPAGQQLVVRLHDDHAADRNELYVQLGGPPSRDDSEYRSAAPAADQEVVVPATSAGVYYILVYTAAAPAPPSSFTLSASTALFLTGVTPDHYGTGGDATLTVDGGGFDGQTTVRLVSAGGTSYAPATLERLSPTRLTATFAAGSVPPGTYAVEVARGEHDIARRPDAFTMVRGGQARFEANVVVPGALGYHMPGTIYLEYRNAGDLAMPAPLLILTPTQTHAGGTTTASALLTLDAGRVATGLKFAPTAVGNLPDGFTHSIQVFANGRTPGVLEPGETVRIPIYWAGWQFDTGTPPLWDFSYPKFNFALRTIGADDATAVDWAAMKDALRPDDISPAAWTPIFANLTGQVGNTWGSYIRALDADASYLGRLGENVRDLNALWGFEVQQAVGLSPISYVAASFDAGVATPGLALDVRRVFSNSIVGHYQAGPFGFGWFTPWQTTLSVDPDGSVVVHGMAGADRRFRRDGRGVYLASQADLGTVTPSGSGGFLLREQDGSVTAFRSDGLLDYTQDTLGNRITAGRNALGQLVSLTHSSGQFLQLFYNGSGLIDHITDSYGRTITYGYDLPSQHLRSVTGFDGRVVEYTYDTSAGTATSHALLSVAYPDGRHDVFGYDPRGRLVDFHHDGGAGQATFSYGPGGLVTATDAAGHAGRTYFNEQGLVARTVDPLGRTTDRAYDANFNLVRLTDPAGQVSTFQYDARGNLLASTDPAGRTVRYTYAGAFDQVATATDAKGNTTAYAYDARGNLSTITYADSSQERYDYDPMGNLSQSINRRGAAIGYEYNAGGQLTRETFADDSHLDTTYDGHGRPETVSLTDPDGHTSTWTFTYDPVKEDLIQITEPDGRFLKFTYDASGQRTRSEDSDHFVQVYHYDAVGRLVAVTDDAGHPIAAYTYDLVGQLAEKDLGNGTYTTYAYDEAGQLLHLVNHGPRADDGADGPVNSRFDYTYDALGRQESLTTLDGRWTYTYDPTGQLTHAVFTSADPSRAPDQDLQYFYDAAGNRTSTVLNGVTTTYATDVLNQYTRVGSTTYGYDADGDLISRTDDSGTTTYTYDDRKRLIGVASPAGTWTYTYDPFGNRDSVEHDGQTTRFSFDPMSGDVVSARGPGSTTHYTHGLGLASVVDPSGTHYYDFDALGSTAGLTDALGGYVNTYSYLPFGETTTLSSGVANPFTFVGQFGVSADGSGLFKMGARSYDPGTGQFTSVDPLGLAGGDLNPRRYVSNNPVLLVDPSGYYIGEKVQVGNQEVWVRDVSVYGMPAGATHDNGTTVPNDPAPGQTTIYLNTDGPYYKQSRDDILEHEKRHVLNSQQTKKLSTVDDEISASLAGAASAKIHGHKAYYDYQYNKVKSLRNGHDYGGEAGYKHDAPLPPSGVGAGGPGGSSRNAASQDPNAKIGPAGFGAPGYVDPGTLLPYRVEFENDAEATAPAQEVTITDPLSPDLDWDSFELTEVGFGDLTIAVPAGSRHFATTVPLVVDGRTIEVEIEVGLDPATGRVEASFRSIDPDTGLPPDVLTGFLPPEDGTGRGTGFFSYTVRARAGLPSGREIRNVASISFDLQQVITTDQVDPHDPSRGVDPDKQALVTIDAGAPTSGVSSLPALTATPSFLVSWSGADDPDGSGIASYDVYVSQDGGEFKPFQVGTTETSATFGGTDGHTYAFYSVATDNVGHREAKPASAEATTTVLVPEATSLSAVAGSGTYGQSATLTATLTAGGTSLAGKTVVFTLGVGTPQVVGQVMTDASGVATLGGVSLAGLNADTFAHFVGARFDGDAGDLASSALGDLVVGKATASVTLDPASLARTYDGTPKLATAATNPAGLAVSVAYARGGSPVASPTDAGSYAVTATIVDPNYQGSGTGTLTIAKANQLITFASLPNRTFGDADFVLTATASSGLPVSYSILAGGAYATLSGGTVHLVGAGDVTLRASQGGNGNYNAAASVDRTFTIARATTTVVLGGLTGQVYTGAGLQVTASAPGATGPSTFTITYNGSTTPPVHAGSYAVVATLINDDYQGSTSGTMVVGKATPTIAWAHPADIVYGKALGSVQLSATASVPGTFQYTPAAGTVLHAGAGQVLSATFTPANATDYAGATIGTMINVLKATPTVKATGVHVTYDGAPHPATATIAGVNGDNLVPALTVTYGGSAAAPAGAGTYAVLAAFAGNSDYLAASDASQSVVIDKATPAFAGLSSPTIVPGASSTVLSGVLRLNGLVPTGSVTITLNGVTTKAAIGAGGAFAASFSTSALAPGSYAVSYGYPGDANFKAAAGASTLVVNYNISTSLDPNKANKSGGTVPIELQLTDAAGKVILSPSTVVTAVSVVDQDGNAVPLQWPGNSNPGGVFKYDAKTGTYQLNLKTSGYAAGRYTIYIRVGDDPTLRGLSFLVR